MLNVAHFGHYWFFFICDALCYLYHPLCSSCATLWTDLMFCYSSFVIQSVSLGNQSLVLTYPHRLVGLVSLPWLFSFYLRGLTVLGSQGTRTRPWHNKKAQSGGRHSSTLVAKKKSVSTLHWLHFFFYCLFTNCIPVTPTFEAVLRNASLDDCLNEPNNTQTPGNTGLIACMHYNHCCHFHSLCF